MSEAPPAGHPGHVPEPGETKSAGSSSSTAALDAAAWVQAGIKMLVRESIECVRIERVANELGVPDTQFYLHFKSEGEFHSAILDRWFHKTTVGICERAERESSTAYERLQRLLELPFWSSKISLAADLELAIRDWARRSSATRDVVRQADEWRLSYLTQLFVALKFDVQEAAVRSHQAYALVRYLSQIAQSGEDQINAIVQNGLCCLTRR
jgi:AcrR family transcriptional regulator